jgi:hypothetical protein
MKHKSRSIINTSQDLNSWSMLLEIKSRDIIGLKTETTLR